MFKNGVFSGPNTGKYGPEKTPYFDNFHAVNHNMKCVKHKHELFYTDMKN